MIKTYTLLLGDNEVDVEVEVYAERCYAPAKGLGGPWENSSPDESYCEVSEVKILTTVLGFSEDEVAQALDEQIGQGRLEDDVWQEFMAEDSGVFE